MSKEVNINIKGSTEINENPIGLLEASPVYKPFRYPWAYDMWLMQQRLHWLPEEVNMSEDVKDWNNKLDEKEIHLITQILRFFTQADCVPLNTRLLTSTGFKALSNLEPNDLVAQVSKDGKLSFVKPLVSSNAIKHKNEGNIVHFTGNAGRFSISVTENHNMVFKRDGELIKQKAKDVEFKKGDQLIIGVTPTFSGDERELSQIERLKVAFNERGHITKKRGGYVYTFSPSDEQERAYIYRLLHSEMRLPIETEKVKYEGEEFVYLTISSLDDKNKILDCLRETKSYDWVELDNISSVWCESFIKEVSIYGHVENNEIRYFTQNKNSVEKVQIVSLLAGYQAFYKPNTTKLGNKGFSLDIIKQDVITINHVKKEIEKSDEMVSCVKVPEGNILVERNGIPVVTGNCEVNNAYTHIYSQIFKPFEIQMMLSCFSNIECFDKESELLTDSGWKLCPDVKETDKIAQYNKETGEISFVVPDKVVSYPYKGVMHHYKNKRTDIMVTPNHDLILKHPTSGKVVKRKSLEGKWDNGYLYPTSSSSLKYEIEDYNEEKTLTLPESINALSIKDAQEIVRDILGRKNNCDFVTTDKKDADKIQAISVLAGVGSQINVDGDKYIVTLNSENVWLEYPHREEVDYDDKVYCVSVPHQNLVSRRNGRVAITGNTIHVAAYSHLLDTIGMPEIEYSAFLKYKAMKDKFEAMHDYHITDKKGIALAIATFSGFMEGLQLFASFAILLNFPRYNRLKGMGQIVSWSVRDETIHVMGMIKLFRTFIAENPEIWTDEFRESIKKICIDCVKHEDAFIDLAFELGGVNGLEADEVKRYIRFIADRRLTMMSIEPIYNIEENPLPWVDDMVNAVEHTNFFENRATEYSRAGTTGTWDEAFESENFLKNGKIPSVKGSKWI